MKPEVSTSFGSLLRRWRGVRGFSQLNLALEAGVSSRHVSFLETGRAKPSRAMVERLAEVLDVPLRERNRLLEAAGFAPSYRETDLSAPEMEAVRRVLGFLLERHEPYPCVVQNGRRDIVWSNRGATRLLQHFVPDAARRYPDGANAIELVCDRDALRPYLVNWESVARVLVAGLERDAGRIPGVAELLERILSDPDVPRGWTEPGSDATSDAPQAGAAQAASFVLPLHLKKDPIELRLLTCVSVLGAARDITLAELRLETFLPADPATDEALQRLSQDSVTAARSGTEEGSERARRRSRP